MTGEPQVDSVCLSTVVVGRLSARATEGHGQGDQSGGSAVGEEGERGG